MISVIKRDGHRATYDRNKIVSAIQKANTEVDQEERISEEQIYKDVRYLDKEKYEPIYYPKYVPKANDILLANDK